MKKIMIILSMVCGLFVISGCGNSDNQSKDNNATASAQSKYADKAFLEDFKQGLYDRWDYADSVDNMFDDPTGYTKEFINKELKHISKYTNKEFKDLDLQEYAIKYINNLKKSKTFDDYTYLVFVNTDGNTKDNEYGKLYDERVIMLKEMITKFNIKFSNDHKDDYKSIINNANDAIKDKKKEEVIHAIVNNVNFENKGDGEYEATVTNNSGYDFKSLDISINLLNQDNVVMESEIDYVENIDNGQKFIIKFYNNEAKFSSTKTVIKYYELK